MPLWSRLERWLGAGVAATASAPLSTAIIAAAAASASSRVNSTIVPSSRPLRAPELEGADLVTATRGALAHYQHLVAVLIGKRRSAAPCCSSNCAAAFSAARMACSAAIAALTSIADASNAAGVSEAAAGAAISEFACATSSSPAEATTAAYARVRHQRLDLGDKLGGALVAHAPSSRASLPPPPRWSA